MKECSKKKKGYWQETCQEMVAVKDGPVTESIVHKADDTV